MLPHYPSRRASSCCVHKNLYYPAPIRNDDPLLRLRIAGELILPPAGSEKLLTRTTVVGCGDSTVVVVDYVDSVGCRSDCDDVVVADKQGGYDVNVQRIVDVSTGAVAPAVVGTAIDNTSEKGCRHARNYEAPFLNRKALERRR